MVRQLLLVASAALVAFSAAEQEVLAATSESRLVSSSVETEAGHSHGLRAKQHVSEDVDKLWVTAFGGTPASGGVLATLTGGIFTDPLLVSGHVSLSKKRFDDPSALNDPMYGFAGSSGACRRVARTHHHTSLTVLFRGRRIQDLARAQVWN